MVVPARLAGDLGKEGAPASRRVKGSSVGEVLFQAEVSGMPGWGLPESWRGNQTPLVAKQRLPIGGLGKCFVEATCRPCIAFSFDEHYYWIITCFQEDVLITSIAW